MNIYIVHESVPDEGGRNIGVYKDYDDAVSVAEHEIDRDDLVKYEVILKHTPPEIRGWKSKIDSITIQEWEV